MIKNIYKPAYYEDDNMFIIRGGDTTKRFFGMVQWRQVKKIFGFIYYKTKNLFYLEEQAFIKIKIGIVI